MTTSSAYWRRNAVAATALLMLCLVVPILGAADGVAQQPAGLRDPARIDDASPAMRRAADAKQMDLDQGGEPALARLFGEFYERRNYRFAWSDSPHRAAARELLARVSAAHEDGLCPMRYDIPWLRDRLAGHHDGGGDNAASLDVDLTAAILRYVVHLALGHQAGETLRASARRLDVLAVFEQLRDPAAVNATLAGLQVPHVEYARLRRALARYRGIVLQGGWRTQTDDLRLRPGDIVDTETLSRLTERLQITGDLAQGWKAPAGERTYTENLVDAVRRFQRRHGLVVDGIVGPATLAALNVPASMRLAQIEINMDRWRRQPDDLGDVHVQVNIPAFRVRVVDKSRSVLQMRAIVGAPHTQTPAFSDRIRYLEFNPYWNVPASIVRNELAPEAADDPSGLVDRGFEVLEGWGEDADAVDPFVVDWEAERFQYRVRQQPGPENVLGLVKFMFPNRYSVYLHDSPARHLFRRNVRALSHGCVRVQDPAGLAEALLPEGEWPRARIEAAMASGRREVVRLATPIPVHLWYFTAWVASDNAMHFRDDVYGRDHAARAWLRCGAA